VQGHSYQQFSGSGFGKPSAGTQLSASFWQWFWLPQCKHAAIGNFLALVLVSPVQGRSYRQFSGSGFGKPTQCKDAANGNFPAVVLVSPVQGRN
jgi:hypothetical protein